MTVRYPRELRADPQQIAAGAGADHGWRHDSRWGHWRGGGRQGTPGIRTENALLSAYIFVDIRDRDIGGYVAGRPKA